jgi:hypothetical protein
MLAPSVLFFSLIFLVVRGPMKSGDASNQNRSAEGEQLDDGIVDTFVSALLLMSACHKVAVSPKQMRSSLIESP